MKIFVIAAGALFSFSPLPLKKDASDKAIKFAALTPGRSFHVSGSYEKINEVGTTCNGQVIHFPSLTFSYNYVGVDHKNMYMTQGWNRVTGTGVNPATGETFVVDFETRFNRKIAESHGAVVIRERTANCFVGNMGTLDCIRINLHTTINAKAEEVHDNPKIEVVCQ